MQNTRINIFDGIRGWGAIMVLLSHLCGTIPHMAFLRKTPLAIITDGFLAVYIFFILSGIVLSLSSFKYKNLICVASLLIKRLPRLSIPIFFSCCFVYILLLCNLMYNKLIDNSWLSEFYNFNPSIIDVIKFSFYGVFFNYIQDVSYNVVLWTMPIELYGSVLVALVLVCINYTRFKFFFLIMVCVTLFIVNKFMACFLIGSIVSYIFVNKKEVFILLRNRNVKILLFIIFLLTYKVVALDRANKISAAIIVLLPFMFEGVSKFLDLKVSAFLGKISFPLYIVHLPILCSFTSYMILHFGDNYLALCVITMTSIILSIFAAFLFLPMERFAISIARNIANYILSARKQ